MAKFDAENMCLVKSTEVILVPELGARLGNFNVANISEKEKWLLTAEWMQPFVMTALLRLLQVFRGLKM